MAMGRRKDRARKPALWIATNELPQTGGHPFYHRLNQVLDQHGFDDFVEGQCAPFYAAKVGRPSLTPGTYFRLLLIGYFEGLDSERGIAWRTADSLALRGFLGLGLADAPPEHTTVSRTRRLIDLETHRAVYVDPAGARDGKSRQGQNDWDRRDYARGQRGPAQHCAPTRARPITTS
jgi:transposase